MLVSIFRASSTFLEAIILLAAYAIVLLAAIILHELGHGYVAYLNGDETAKMAGRLSLNPAKHLSLVGTIMMLLVGFGWAKPVPIDPRNFREYKKGMILTSLGGVTVNLCLAFINSVGLALILKFAPSSFTTRNFEYYLVEFFLYLFYLGMQVNVLLMVFNLLPIYPLDGFRIVETLADPDNRFVNFMYRYGNWVMIAFIGISFVSSSVFGTSLFGMVNDLAQLIFNKIWGAILGVSF
jgi:Zn-dependent protease